MIIYIFDIYIYIYDWLRGGNGPAQDRCFWGCCTGALIRVWNSLELLLDCLHGGVAKSRSKPLRVSSVRAACLSTSPSALGEAWGERAFPSGSLRATSSSLSSVVPPKVLRTPTASGQRRGGTGEGTLVSRNFVSELHSAHSLVIWRRVCSSLHELAHVCGFFFCT